MAFVYIVTSGEYSDYSIDAVFSTEKKANEYAATHRGTWNDARVEQWELDIIEGG